MSAYSVAAYGDMIADRVRMDAYVQALREAIRPGAVVVDIGAGTGIFSMLACQLGARRVYAIEPDDAIQVARDIAALNGFADRIEFFQELSTKVALPQRADVIVSDIRGVLPMHQHHFASIADARHRLLAPGGRLIPRSDTLWAAVVAAPDLYRRCTEPWADNTHALKMDPARRLVSNTWTKRRLKPEQILLPPQAWLTLDYTTIVDSNVEGEIEWIVEHPGTADGLTVWFDATLADGIAFSNAPGKPETIYGNAYFPWWAPVMLDAGDKVEIALRANLVGDDYVWRWNTRVLARGDRSGVKADFHQSSLAGAPLSPQQLRRHAHDHVPMLNERGAIVRSILEQMALGSRNDEIARALVTQFPDRFRTWQEALTEVGELALRYGA